MPDLELGRMIGAAFVVGGDGCCALGGGGPGNCTGAGGCAKGIDLVLYMMVGVGSVVAGGAGCDGAVGGSGLLSGAAGCGLDAVNLLKAPPS
jgi:hypothetical protein